MKKKQWELDSLPAHSTNRQRDLCLSSVTLHSPKSLPWLTLREDNQLSGKVNTCRKGRQGCSAALSHPPLAPSLLWSLSLALALYNGALPSLPISATPSLSTTRCHKQCLHPLPLIGSHFSLFLWLGFSLKEAMHHTPQLHNSLSLCCLCVEQQKTDLRNILTVENCLVLFFLSHLKGMQTSIHLFYFSPSSPLLRVANSSCYT